MPRTHDRTHFYKYLTADSAKLILESGRLLWSAPHLFNDPFDHRVTYNFPFGEGEFSQALYEKQKQIIFGAHEPEFIQPKPLGYASLMMRNARVEGRVDEAVLPELEQAAKETAENLNEWKYKLNSALTGFLSHSRVFCVSERLDNVVMWSHYSDEHRGAVLKLNAVEEVDDNLIIARKVSYIDEFPEFIPLEKWIEEYVGQYKIDHEQLAFDLAYMKHKDWAYEDEWRVHIPLMPGEPAGDGRSLYEKHPSVFGALYLGYRMEEDTQKELTEIARSRYPGIEVFHAEMSNSSFTLNFEKI